MALAANRHKMPHGRSLALKLSEYVTGEGEIENLLPLNTKRPDDDRWLIFIGGVLIASLMAADLIDEYLLMISPLVLGTGRRLFAGGSYTRLRLVDSSTTSKGVLIATYEPARG